MTSAGHSPILARTFAYWNWKCALLRAIARSIVYLAAMARTEVTITYTIPAGTTANPGTEILLWIQGCRLHFQRWIVKLGTISADTDKEVCVKDGPENLHHWYDHFYCPHPCLPQQDRSRQ